MLKHAVVQMRVRRDLRDTGDAKNPLFAGHVSQAWRRSLTPGDLRFPPLASSHDAENYATRTKLFRRLPLGSSAGADLVLHLLH